MENEPVGLMRTGRVDGEKYERGMLVRFDSAIKGWKSADMLIIRTPSDKHLSMTPEFLEDDRLCVNANVARDTSLRFWLVPVDATTARLDMEDHHVELLARLYGDA